MANSYFKLDARNLLKGLENIRDKADIAIEMKADEGARKLQESAQLNARWQNQTGEARRRLTGYYETVPEGYKIYLAHGVNYGIWLELANEMRYSIIPETIEYVGTFEILPDFEDFMNKLKGVS